MFLITRYQIVNMTADSTLQNPIVILFFFDDVNCDLWLDDCGKPFDASHCLLNRLGRQAKLLRQNAAQFVENKRGKNKIYFSSPYQLHHLIGRATGNDPGRNQDIGVERNPHSTYLRTSSTIRSISSSVSTRSAVARCRTARRNPLSLWRSRYSRSASRISSLFVRCSFFASFSVSLNSRGGIESVTTLLCLIGATSCLLHCNIRHLQRHCQVFKCYEWT